MAAHLYLRQYGIIATHPARSWSRHKFNYNNALCDFWGAGTPLA